MHINWKTNRSLSTTAEHVFGTEKIPSNKYNTLQGVQTNIFSVRYLYEDKNYENVARQEGRSNPQNNI
jgi:hypothetical protein